MLKITDRKCADCGCKTEKPKTWCNKCYKKRTDKWDQEIREFREKHKVDEAFISNKTG